jgi:aspartoacylase
LQALIIINTLAIVGGTHGNEITGPYLLRRWAANPAEITRESFTTTTFWASPKAFYENKRYIDADLNRCFLNKDLLDKNIFTHEGDRAKVINSYFGPKQNPAVDFLIDIHTTNSNMGVTLISFKGDDEYNFKLAAFIKSQIPIVNLYHFTDEKDVPYLASITTRRLVLEIGPIPDGVLKHDIFDQANRVVQLALDFIHKVNLGVDPDSVSELEVYVHKTTVSFPLDKDGNIFGMVHRELDGRDFKALRKGDPIFMKLNGEIVRFEEQETAYPVFINASAYYENKVAFSLSEKTMRKI